MLLLIPIGLFLTYVLPILLFVRVRALTRRLDDALARLERMERLERSTMAPEAAPPVRAAVVAPAAPVAAPAPRPAPAPEPPSPPRPAVAAPPRRAPAPTADAFTIEREIGGRWMLVVGALILVMGIAFFVKYSFERHWITETARVAIGTVAGIVAWAAGLWFIARGYTLYGRIVAGGGLAMIFVAAFAASALYGLVPPSLAFGWMAVASGATVVTADRQRAFGLALFAIVLAFAAPFLVGSTSDAHVVLFAYDTAVAAAALALVRRQGWAGLGPAALGLTWITFALWFGDAYRSAYFVSTEIYLSVVTAIYLAAFDSYRRRDDRASSVAATVLALGPFLYHITSIRVLSEHSVWLLVYLITVTAVGLAFTAERAALRLVLWLAVALPLAGWVGAHVSRSWYAATLATAGAVYLLHLAAQLRVARPVKDAPLSELVLFHANGLGLFAFTYLSVSAHGGSTAALAFFLAAGNGLLTFAMLAVWPALTPHALALVFAFTATGVAIQLSGPWITVAWAAEGAAVVWAGLYARRSFLRIGGAALVAAAVERLVVMQFGHTSAAFTPILNSRTMTGAFLVALIYGIGVLYRHDPHPLDKHRIDTASATTTVAANVLTVGLLTADIYSYWLAREAGLTADFARELTISLTWAAYGMGLISLGFTRGSTTLRYLALVLFGVTVTKMFTIDLLELGGIYRVTGFIGLGLLLLAASFLYQRVQARATSAPGPASPESTPI